VISDNVYPAKDICSTSPCWVQQFRWLLARPCPCADTDAGDPKRRGWAKVAEIELDRDSDGHSIGRGGRILAGRRIGAPPSWRYRCGGGSIGPRKHRPEVDRWLTCARLSTWLACLHACAHTLEHQAEDALPSLDVLEIRLTAPSLRAPLRRSAAHGFTVNTSSFHSPYPRSFPVTCNPRLWLVSGSCHVSLDRWRPRLQWAK
jgi:hypothetical protein